MPYRAVDKTIDLNVINNHISSGIARLRSDDDELMSIFSSITLSEREKIRDWFSSDECDIKVGWGFIIDPEVVPVVNSIIVSDAVAEKFIGNMAPMSMIVADNDYPTNAWNFGKTISVEIGYDRSAYAYYLYEIIKHILLIAEESLTSVFDFKDIMFQGGSRMPMPRPQGGGYVFVYSAQLTYKELELISEVENLDTIESVVISQGSEVYQLTDNEEGVS